MQFRIADTFTDNLAKLSNDEQKAVKTTAFDLQLNPANPGMQLHKKVLDDNVETTSNHISISTMHLLLKVLSSVPLL